MSAYTYTQIIQAIKDECGKINLTYSKEGDGRLTSAVKETEYLSLLEAGLKEKHPSLKFEKQPVERWWWDFRVNAIPFNLKLTTGGTDNAFNKVAILFSLTGKEVEKRNMNFNQFFKILKDTPKKTERNRMTEYHYLVVNKTDGKVLLKPILDIHTFKSNPCNDLQINWANEFLHMEFVIPDGEFQQKIQQLLKTIQTSIRQAIASMNDFANADIEAEFPK
jgi:hypothetical protein